MARLAFPGMIVLFSILAASAASRAADLRITTFELSPEGSARLTFEDSATGILNYVPASRSNLQSPSQLVLTRISEIEQGRFQALIPQSASNGFFQIVGFSGPDADADGVSDALENILSTSTSTFDSDDDGFGDAYEIQAGSDPVRADSVPQDVKVNFASAQSSVSEGDGVHQVHLSLSRSYTGTIRYRVADLSTASASTDVALSGVAEASGTTAVIQIPILDDLVIEQVKTLVLDIEADPENYLPGGASRHIILLYDNDSYWSGVLRNDDSEQSFRMRLLRHGSQVQGALVSSLDTNSADGIQGVGTIPPGTWPLSSAQLTSTHFQAISSPIPVGTSTLFGGSTLNRILNLVAEPDQTGSNPGTNYWMKPNLIMGTYTDTLTPSSPALGYLQRQTSGVFVLMEDLPILPAPESAAAATFKRQLSSNSRTSTP
jgi:hypothetical protein